MKLSKSEFKAKALEIFRMVENTGESVLVTDRGVPTIEVRRYTEQLRSPKEILYGSVMAFEVPLKPTGEKWEALE